MTTPLAQHLIIPVPKAQPTKKSGVGQGRIYTMRGPVLICPWPSGYSLKTGLYTSKRWVHCSGAPLATPQFNPGSANDIIMSDYTLKFYLLSHRATVFFDEYLPVATKRTNLPPCYGPESATTNLLRSC